MGSHDARRARSHAVAAKIPEHGGFGICITGLLRTLLLPLVRDSFHRHVVRPITRAGLSTTAFVAVVGRWPEASYNHTLLREAIRDAYAAEAVTALAPRSPNYRCPPPELSRSTSRFSFGTTDVLIQFVAIRRCYAMLVAAEQRRGQQYAYVMRLRTDILYMEDIPIAAILQERGEQQVFVPQFGMGPPERSNRCLNDHLFVCPRRMCRPYFELLEIFENPYCTDNTVAGSIFFSSQSLERPPSAPFFLWHPPSSVSSQAYVLARYSANATMIAKALTSRCDGEPECGCGHGSLVTQLRWIYTIVAQSSGKDPSSFRVNCGRPWWSGEKHRLAMPLIKARVESCKEAANASLQDRVANASVWLTSSFVRTFHSDCKARWSCSQAGAAPPERDTGRRLSRRSQTPSRNTTIRATRSLRETPNSTALPCSYAFVATKSYFTGLAVVLHSLKLANGNASSDCEIVLMLWHPEHNDTALALPQRRLLQSLAAPSYKVVFRRVNHTRFSLWRRIRGMCHRSYNRCMAGYTSSLLKLELFFINTTGVVVLLDADMLVVKSIANLIQTLTSVSSQTLSWHLHGSDEAFNRNVNGGFLAFLTPVPAEVREALWQISLAFAARSHNTSLRTSSRTGPEKGDQDIMNIALRAVDKQHFPQRYRSRKAKPKPKQLHLHLAWHANDFPSSEAALRQDRVLHWAGLLKPWNSRQPLTFPANPSCHAGCRSQMRAARAMWHASCRLAASASAAAGDAEGLLQCGKDAQESDNLKIRRGVRP